MCFRESSQRFLKTFSELKQKFSTEWTTFNRIKNAFSRRIVHIHDQMIVIFSLLRFFFSMSLIALLFVSYCNCNVQMYARVRDFFYLVFLSNLITTERFIDVTFATRQSQMTGLWQGLSLNYLVRHQNILSIVCYHTIVNKTTENREKKTFL